MNARYFNFGLGALVWVASTISVFYIVFAVTFGDARTLPVVGTMLSRPNPLDRAAPIAILAVFTWVLVELFIRYWNARAQYSAVAAFQNELVNPTTALAADDTDAPRALRRAHLIKQHLQRDPSSLRETLPAAAALDGATLLSGYAALHVYAWILPVLGFVGTASGMASAIQGFQSARSETSRVEILVTRLSQLVIPGLSAAFETTVLALLASLVAFFCTSALQAWDQFALDKLDYACLDYLPQQQAPLEIVDPGAVAILREISNQLGLIIHIPQSIEASVNSLTHAASTLQIASDGLQQASDELHRSVVLPYIVKITRGDAE